MRRCHAVHGWLIALVLAGAAAAAPEVSGELAKLAGLIESRRLPEAREPLEAWMSAHPEDGEAAWLLGRVYAGLGRREQAIRLLERFTGGEPGDARLLALCGEMHLMVAVESPLRGLSAGRRGVVLLERAVALAPAEATYREALVAYCREAPALAGGGGDRALLHARELAKADPVRGAAWLSTLWLERGRPDEAWAACERALAVRPQDYGACYHFGRLAAETGQRLDAGEAALMNCLRLAAPPEQPGHATVWEALGKVSERRGDLAGARRAYGQAVGLEPGRTSASDALRRVDAGR